MTSTSTNARETARGARKIGNIRNSDPGSISSIWEPQPPFPAMAAMAWHHSKGLLLNVASACVVHPGDPAVMCSFGACFLLWNPNLLMIKSQFSVVKSMCLIMFDPDIVHSPILMDRSRFLLPTVIPIFHDPNPMFGLRSHICLVLKIRSVS